VTRSAVGGPLDELIAALRRLVAGDDAARASVAGPAEVREAARLVNALADARQRWRYEEVEHARLRTVARDAGNRIRASLSAQDVVREAVVAIDENLDADVAYLHLFEDGRMGPPERHEHDWALPADWLSAMPTKLTSWLTTWWKRLLASNSSQVIQDLGGEEGAEVPDYIRTPMLRAGVVSHILTPFGSDGELTGLVVADRLKPGHPWTAAEIEAFESIAADTGRGLKHARIYEAENRLVADLKALDRARTDFLATVSHELRTPLTSIAGYVELLMDEAAPLTSGQKVMLDTIARNASLLQTLIEDILMLSRIELGVSPGKRASVDLAESVAAAVRTIQPVAEAGQVTVTAARRRRGLVVNGDASQLDRVLMNLLSNAVKFTPAGGTVTVSAICDGPWVAVRIADTGIGIPEGDKKNLFSRFYRASNAMARSLPGTGLGLSISRTIVADHGGEMEIESQEGVGTTVTVRLLRQHTRRPAGRPAGGDADGDADGTGAVGPAGAGPAGAGPAGAGPAAGSAQHLPRRNAR
jgi:signal transduction histidine kinase